MFIKNRNKRDITKWNNPSRARSAHAFLVISAFIKLN